MKVTPEIINHEFIGTHGSIASSQHADYMDISGQVVDETKNTFIFQHEG